MISKSTFMWLGIVIFLAGGAVLAFTDGATTTTIGTTMWLVGVALVVWSWFRTSARHEPE